MSGARADFASTRHQLDQLGYHQHLSKDCVDLVAVILGDLITTTNTCKQYQSELDSKQSQLEIIKNMDNPLQYELDRLTIENNRLHRDIVKVRNEKEVAEKESEQTLRELKQKNQQLLLLNSQLKRDNALEKSKQVIGNQNLEMELGSTRPLSPITNQSLNQNVVSDTVNLLKLSEQSRAALQDELDKMRKKTYHLESELKSLNEQIISSDNNAKVSLHLRNPNLQELQRAKDRINLLESHVQVLQEHLDEVDRGSKSKSPIKFCDCADERARNAQLCLKIKEMEELLQVAENKLSKSKYTPVKKPVPLKKQSQITPKKPKPSKNEAKLSSSIIEEQIDDNEKLTKRIEDLEMSLKTMVFKNETLDQKLQDMKIERNRIQKKFHGCEKERDILLKAFEKFESDLDKVQKKVKSISKEKDHYRYLYQSTMRDFNKGKLAINKSKTDLEHKLEKLRDENKSLLEKIENSKNPISNDKDAVRLQKELQQQNLELIESNKLRDEIFRQREQIQNELDTTVGRLNELECSMI